MKGIKTKGIPYVVTGAVLLMLLGLNLLCQDHWLDSDMAAEMMFSRLLAEDGHLFATPDWYYSTEFRFLYTHLIMGPLFRITDNWHLIRTITNLVFYVLMLSSYFYFVKPLKISNGWKWLTGSILLLPFSETMMTHMQMGNTYMSHVILIYWFFGMFLRLTDAAEMTKGKKAVLWVLYLGLALVCGISGVRYLLALQCPLVLTAFAVVLQAEEFQALRQACSKERFRALLQSKRITYLWVALAGAVGSVAGYGVNVVWVSKHYVFQMYDATNFIALYHGVLFERLQNAIGCLLMLFGYIPDKGVISLRGVITIISFVILAVLAYCARRSSKSSKGIRSFITQFLVISFVLNVFVFVFTTSTMVPRYYITILMFALPVIAFYMEEEKLVFDRVVVALILVGCLTLSTAKTVYSFVTVDKNESKRPVAEFLAENDYTFGFATYTNGNIVTELTNGEVEIANIGDPQYLEYFKWSSPMRYYEDGYCDGEIFVLLTAGEMAEFAECAAVQNGEVIYEDSAYTVLLYDSLEQLMGYADSRN